MCSNGGRGRGEALGSFSDNLNGLTGRRYFRGQICSTAL